MSTADTIGWIVFGVLAVAFVAWQIWARWKG